MDPGIYEYLHAYGRYQKGYLPNSGGWLDQAAKFIAVIDIIENELAMIEQDEVENQIGGLKK